MIQAALVCALVAGAPDARTLPGIGVSFAIGAEFEEIVGNLPDLEETEREVGRRVATSLGENIGFLDFAEDLEFTPANPTASSFDHHVRITLRGPLEAAAGEDAPPSTEFFENHFELELWDTRRRAPITRRGTEATAYPIAYVKTDSIRAHVRDSVLAKNIGTEFLARLDNHREQIVRDLFSQVPIDKRMHMFVTSRPAGDGGHKTRIFLPHSYDQLFIGPGTTFMLEDFTRDEDGEREATRWARAAGTSMYELYDDDIEGGREVLEAKGVPADYWALFSDPIILKDEALTGSTTTVDPQAGDRVRDILDMQGLPQAYNGPVRVWALYVTESAPGGRGLQRLQDQIRTLPPNPFAASN